MQNILEADSIRKSFGDKQVLTDIYFKCRTGDIIGLLGRNGSGKTTLLKILYGTLYTEYKYITINGSVLDKPFKIKGTISFLNQDSFIPKDLIVRQVPRVFYPHLDNPDFFNDDILSKVKDTKIRDISGGELRYLEIKIILNLKTKFALLDEPFNGMSPLHIDLVKEMIKGQSATKGILLTDHDYRNVLDVANEYMFLYDGGLKILKSKADFITWGYIPDK